MSYIPAGKNIIIHHSPSAANAMHCIRPMFRLPLLAALLTIAFLRLAPQANASQVTVTNHIAIKHAQKWNPAFWFGNADDPVPPADYRPHDHNRIHKWYLRNHTHNFTFYVMGIADKTFRRSGKYPSEVFNPRGGWNWAVCKYKFIRLPFISYQRKHFGFYLGWRERGNFGAKFHI